MTAEQRPNDVVRMPPLPPFSLKPLLSLEDTRGDQFPESETIAQLIEQLHPEQPAYTTIKNLVRSNRHQIRPNPLIHEDDQYAVIGLQNEELFVSRTFKAENEAIPHIAEGNTRELMWLLDGMVDLETYSYSNTVDLQKLGERVLSNIQIEQTIRKLTPKVLSALEKDPQFVKWAGHNWRINGIPIPGIVDKGYEKIKIAYFGTIPNAGPLLYLQVRNMDREGFLFQLGNTQSKSQTGKVSRILYWNPEGQVIEVRTPLEAQKIEEFIQKIN